MQWDFTFRGKFRIVAIEEPLTRLYRRFLVLHRGGHIDPVSDAMAIGDDQGWPIIGLSFEKGF